MERHELSDDQWEKIKDLLPGRKGHVGRNGVDNRKFINAVFWISKTGSPWRDLPIEGFLDGLRKTFGKKYSKH